MPLPALAVSTFGLLLLIVDLLPPIKIEWVKPRNSTAGMALSIPVIASRIAAAIAANG